MVQRNKKHKRLDSSEDQEHSDDSSKPREMKLHKALEREDASYFEKLMRRGREWYVQQWAKKYPFVAKFLDDYKATQVFFGHSNVSIRFRSFSGSFFGFITTR